MPVSATTLQLLADVGLSLEQVIIVAASIERDNEPKRSSGAERQRRYRERKRNASDVTSLRNESDVTDPSPKKVSPKPPSKNNPTPQSANADCDASLVSDCFFEDFWKSYPRREGANPKKPAALAFARSLTRGASPEQLVTEAKRLAEKHPTPTPYVPQAVTWLNQDRWKDCEATGPPEGKVIYPVRTVEEVFAERAAFNEARGWKYPETVEDDEEHSEGYTNGRDVFGG